MFSIDSLQFLAFLEWLDVKMLFVAEKKMEKMQTFQFAAKKWGTVKNGNRWEQSNGVTEGGIRSLTQYWIF